LAIAKRPDLLLLDEPAASLDPLARRAFLQGLIEVVVEQGTSVVLSSHLVADLERVCDYLIVLGASRVQLSGEVEELLATHHRLIGPRRDVKRLPANQHVIEESHTDRSSTLLIRTAEPILDPSWTVERVTLDDLVLAYMGAGTRRNNPAAGLAAHTASSSSSGSSRSYTSSTPYQTNRNSGSSISPVLTRSPCSWSRKASVSLSLRVEQTVVHKRTSSNKTNAGAVRLYIAHRSARMRHFGCFGVTRRRSCALSGPRRSATTTRGRFGAT